eukprot:Cvel_7342.t1-p1 / transcript=Cvel_7342.t1 / gene=Cvel_7342 / organism=Chromera_velia_CCMP2878 / gene_product=Cytoskeleton-associated protein 5, putative / transcript_product=Cytoskeleton-associated protein 5, putative / location=Cvel_scaffold380:80315-92891(+) / protein_length=1745 / sequence_SO=supercontig / SO=protein_coding / is_pseudo=false
MSAFDRDEVVVGGRGGAAAGDMDEFPPDAFPPGAFPEGAFASASGTSMAVSGVDTSQPLEKRLVSKKWADRLSAYEEVEAEIQSEKEKGAGASDAVKQYGKKVPGMVADSIPAAQDKGLDAALLWLDTCSHAAVQSELSLGEMVKALLEKGLSGKNADKGKEVMMKVIENFEAPPVIEHILEIAKKKPPKGPVLKLIALCLGALRSILSEFGPRKVPPKQFLPFTIQAVKDLTDKEVREQGYKVLVEMASWTRETKTIGDMLGEGAQKSEFEKRCDPLPPEHSNPRLLRKEAGMQTGAGGGSASSLGASGSSRGGKQQGAQQEGDSFDPSDLLDPVDVFAQMPKGWEEQLVKLEKWSERLQVVAQLSGLLEKNPKLAVSDRDVKTAVHTAVRVLKTDANVKVVGETVKAMALLAGSLKKNFNPHVKILWDWVCGKLKEKGRVAMEAAVWFETVFAASCVTPASMTEEMSKLLQDKNPAMKIQVLELLQKLLLGTAVAAGQRKKAPTGEKIPSGLPSFVCSAAADLLQDGNKEVRDTAKRTLLALRSAEKRDGGKICTVAEAVKGCSGPKQKLLQDILSLSVSAPPGPGASTEDPSGQAAEGGNSGRAQSPPMPIKSGLASAFSKSVPASPGGGAGSSRPGVSRFVSGASVASSNAGSEAGGGKGKKAAGGKGGGAKSREGGGGDNLSLSLPDEGASGFSMTGTDAKGRVVSALGAEGERVEGLLGSSKWQERQEAIQAVKAWVEAEENGEAVKTLGEALFIFLKGAVKDFKEVNAMVMKEALACCQTVLSRVEVALERLCGICAELFGGKGGLGEKLGDIKLASAVHEFAFAWSEALSPGLVSEAIWRGVSGGTISARLSENLGKLLFEMLEEFGFGQMNAQVLVGFAKGQLQQRQKGQRMSGQNLVVLMSKSAGKSQVLPLISDGGLTDATMKEVTEACETATGEAPAPTRLCAVAKAQAAKRGGGVGERAATSGGLSGSMNLSDLLPAVNLSEEISKVEGLLEKISSVSWQERKDGLEGVKGLVEKKCKAKVAPEGLTAFIQVYKQRLTDSNRAVAKAALDLAQPLAAALGPGGARFARALLQPLIGRLADKQLKDQAKGAAGEVLKQVGSSAFLKDGQLAVALTEQSIDQREGVLSLLGEGEGSFGFVASECDSASLLPLVDPLMQCLLDKKPELRDRSEAVLKSVIAVTGGGPLRRAFVDLKPAQQNGVRQTVDGILDFATGGGGSVAGDSQAPSSRPASPVPARGRERSATPQKDRPGVGGGRPPSVQRNKPPAGPPGANKQQRPPGGVTGSSEQAPPKKTIQGGGAKNRVSRVPKAKRQDGKGGARWPSAGMEMRQDAVESLHKDLRGVTSVPLFVALCEASNFESMLRALAWLREEATDVEGGGSDRVVDLLDLVLKFLTVRLGDSNPRVVTATLEALVAVLTAARAKQGELTDFEAAVIFPHLVERVGHNSGTVREKLKEALHVATTAYAPQKASGYLLQGTFSANQRSVADCLDALAELQAKRHPHAHQPSGGGSGVEPRQRDREAQRVCELFGNSRDASVRKAAGRSLQALADSLGPSGVDHIVGLAGQYQTVVASLLQKSQNRGGGRERDRGSVGSNLGEGSRNRERHGATTPVRERGEPGTRTSQASLSGLSPSGASGLLSQPKQQPGDTERNSRTPTPTKGRGDARASTPKIDHQGDGNSSAFASRTGARKDSATVTKEKEKEQQPEEFRLELSPRTRELLTQPSPVIPIMA